MAITHHPDPSTLMSFAAGTLPEALSAVVAGHATLCPSCRRALDFMDEIGGTALNQAPSAALLRQGMADPAAGGGPVPSRKNGGRRPAKARDVPALLAKVLAGDMSDVRWRWLGFGLWHMPLKVSSTGGGDLRLFKVAPGLAMPEHGHNGAELSLILSGSYSDENGTFAGGDLADLDEGHEHRPVTDADAGCVCLIASERPARFKSLIARLVQPFTGL